MRATPPAAAWEPIDRWLAIGGRRLHVRWIGPPPEEAPTLVFLHEGLGCVELWRDFPARLAAATGCGALIYSRAGYGRSDARPLPWPFTYLDEEALDVLPMLLSATRVRQAILIGHSDGAAIALLRVGAAAAGPVLATIAIAPHVFVGEIIPRRLAQVKRAFEAGVLRARLARYHSNIDCAFYGLADIWLDPAFHGWSIESVLPAIRMPVLVLQGTDDPYGGMEQCEAVLRQIGGPAEFVVAADCGHAPHLEQPEPTTAALQRFILDVLERAGG